MATKQKYTIGGVTVRAENEQEATRLASEISANQPITTESVRPEPLANASVPVGGTQTANFQGLLESATTNFTRDLERQAKAQEQVSSNSLERLVAEQLGSEGEVTQTAREYSRAGGVDELGVQLGDLNNQILQEQTALRRQEQKIRENQGGMLAGAIEDEVNRARSESLSRQADLYVIQQGLQGRYDSAKAIADRAVAVRLEQQRNRIDSLKFQYQENKELFNKSEERAFQSLISDRERAFAKEEKTLQDISDLSINALENGAPPTIASQMRQAKTVEEAIRIGGQYVNRLDRLYKTAQIQKIGLENLASEAAARDASLGILDEKSIKEIDASPQGKSLKTLGDLKLKMNNYQNLVEEVGFETVGTDRARLDNAYKELQLSYKEAANLGVLNGPDLALVESAIRSATPGFFGTAGNVISLGQGTRNLRANLEEAQKTLNTGASNNLEQLHARNPAYRDSLYVSALTAPFGDELLTQTDIQNMEEVSQN
jgi:hypothetical protein